jgi:hypothetical protein
MQLHVPQRGSEELVRGRLLDGAVEVVDDREVPDEAGLALAEQPRGVQQPVADRGERLVLAPLRRETGSARFERLAEFVEGDDDLAGDRGDDGAAPSLRSSLSEYLSTNCAKAWGSVWASRATRTASSLASALVL